MMHDPARQIARKIRLAQWALAAERLAAAVFPLVMIAGVILLAVASGLLAALPGLLRACALAAALLALAAALLPLVRLRWPGRAEAVARIDSISGVAHRPLQSLGDGIAGPVADPRQQAVWAAHQARLRRELARLRAGFPRMDWAARDPFALRNGLGVALAAALALNGPSLPQLARASFAPPSAQGAATEGGLDVWITPPSYTGRPPVMLTAAGAPESVSVPQGSALVVRVSGGDEAQAVITPEAGARQAVPLSLSGSSAREGRAVIAAGGELVVTQSGRSLGRWNIAMTPDAPPQVAIMGTPAAAARGALSLAWQASDDYGVARLSGEIALADETAPGAGLFAAPDLSLPLPRLNAKALQGKALSDLTAHPWAGLKVTIRLTARDQAGQVGTSAPVSVTLPERAFRQPLAGLLAEQRKRLVKDGSTVPEVVEILDRVLLMPDDLVPGSGIYLMLRDAELALAHDGGPKGIRSTVEALWRIATLIEDGATDDLRKAVEQARDALAKALAEGRPPEEIAKLVDELRQAMAALLDQMRQQAAGAPQSAKQPQQGGRAKPVQPEDLQKMLDDVARLAGQGATDEAQKMLSALDDILKNLQAGRPQPGQGGEQSAGQMLDQLGAMMQRQQALMDKTFRQGQGAGQGSGDGAAGSGSEPGTGADSQALAQEQDAIGQDLQKLLDGLSQGGLAPPTALGRAGENIRQSGKSLRAGDAGEALPQQGEAMARLREGAQALAEQLSQQGQGEADTQGRDGLGRGDDRDPLGRPRAARGPDYGPQRDMLQGEAQAARARRILEDMRRRANDPALSEGDRSYLDRLLRDFY